MSYITYQVQCQDCGESYNTAFGIVGMRIIAEPIQKCPKCGGAVERRAENWGLEARLAQQEQKVRGVEE